MKNIFLSLLFLMFVVSASSQTATNFTGNDCSSVSHDLFSEMNSGKVIVIAWVMPCASCIGPALSAYTEIQNYDSSHPGRILYYIADDYANTSCASLTTWTNTNGMSGADALFSTSALSMSDYGSPGMPKIVVMGGSTHTVFDNQNNTLNVTDFNNAINAALTTGVKEGSVHDLQMSVSPNPSSSHSIINYALSSNVNVNIGIYNLLGKKVKEISLENKSAGKHEFKLDTEVLESGVYFVTLTAGASSQTLKFVVEH